MLQIPLIEAKSAKRDDDLDSVSSREGGRGSGVTTGEQKKLIIRLL